MHHTLFSRKSSKTWRSRCMAGALILAFWGLFAGGLQPVLAGPLLLSAILAPTDTATLTETPLPGISPSDTAMAISTATPTATLIPTLAPTLTPTRIGSMLILINEVAWMGTIADPEDEWIELYNQGPNPIDLSGWLLRSVDGFNSSLRLTGTIEPGGYFLLAREGPPPFYVPPVIATSTSTTSATAEPVIKVDQTFSGELANEGESLELIAPDGSVIDRANSNNIVNGRIGPWPAGNATTRCSMERGGANIVDSPIAWITTILARSNGRDVKQNKICGTPGRLNWAYSVTATSSPTLTRTRTPTPVRTITPFGTPARTLTSTPNRNRATPSSIVINEFLTQPRSDWNADGKVNSGDEYIEIINLSSLPILISGWRLDDQDGDSNPYTIGNITMQPKVRMAFFTSQTGILLSNGGDSVRLFRSTGVISDAFTYKVVQVPDTTWCRLPDGSNTWVFGCVPTVAESNRLGGSTLIGNRFESSFCLSKTLPLGVLLAECNPLGLSMWDANLWDILSLKYPRFFEVETNLYILE